MSISPVESNNNVTQVSNLNNPTIAEKPVANQNSNQTITDQGAAFKLSEQTNLAEHNRAKLNGDVVVAQASAVSEPYQSAQGLNFSETKGASALSYAATTGEVYEFPDGKQWQVTNTHIDDNTGFRAIILKPLDENDDRRILSFAGTETSQGAGPAISDIWTDIIQSQGIRRPTQYRQAAELAAQYKADFGDNLTLTGHSLGGGMASYAALQTDLNATAVNAAPLSVYSSVHLGRVDIPEKYLTENAFNTPVFRDNISNITQYNAPEFVSWSENAGFGEQPGNTVSVTGNDVTPIASFFTNHMLNNTGAEVGLPTFVRN